MYLHTGSGPWRIRNGGLPKPCDSWLFLQAAILSPSCWRRGKSKRVRQEGKDLDLKSNYQEDSHCFKESLVGLCRTKRKRHSEALLASNPLLNRFILTKKNKDEETSSWGLPEASFGKRLASLASSGKINGTCSRGADAPCCTVHWKLDVCASYTTGVKRQKSPTWQTGSHGQFRNNW